MVAEPSRARRPARGGTSLAESFVGADPETDAERLRNLRRMKAVALGFLVGAAGCGAVCGTLLLASRGNVRGLLRFIVAAALVAGGALVALSQSRLLPLSLVLMAMIGFSILVTSVSINMILQTIVDDDKRGRVMSLYTASFLGVVPLGGLIAGALADQIGATRTLLASGIVCVVGALYLSRQLPLLRRHMRETYARLGLEPSS